MSRLLVVFVFFLAGCAPHKPTSDAGTPQDSGAKEAAACVPDFTSCNAASVCCTSTFVCNPGSGLCEKACLSINSICSSNGDCCSGICNGACQ